MDEDISGSAARAAGADSGAAEQPPEVEEPSQQSGEIHRYCGMDVLQSREQTGFVNIGEETKVSIADSSTQRLP